MKANSMRIQSNVNKLITRMLKIKLGDAVSPISSEKGVHVGMVLLVGVKDAQRFIEHYNLCK